MAILSGFLKLNKADFYKGLVVAGLVAFFGALQQALNGQGLDVASYNWNAILDVTWKATAAYLSKNLLSDSKGRVLGRIG